MKVVNNLKMYFRQTLNVSKQQQRGKNCQQPRGREAGVTKIIFPYFPLKLQVRFLLLSLDGVESFSRRSLFFRLRHDDVDRPVRAEKRQRRLSLVLDDGVRHERLVAGLL